MKILPAIDLREGKVVRLFQGMAEKEWVYSDSPVDIALQFQEDGATHVHCIDLDKAFQQGNNLDVIKQICTHTDLIVEVGGGLREIDEIKEILDSGAHRVILGTKALLDRDFLCKTLEVFSDRIMVSLDFKEGNIAVKGWCETLQEGASEIVHSLCEAGVQWFVFTQISRDGSLEGLDEGFIEAMRLLMDNRMINSIISGGVRDLKDLELLSSIDFPALWGVIVGRALYEGTLDLQSALEFAG